LTDEVVGVEFAGRENDGLKMAEWKLANWNLADWKKTECKLLTNLTATRSLYKGVTAVKDVSRATI